MRAAAFDHRAASRGGIPSFIGRASNFIPPWCAPGHLIAQHLFERIRQRKSFPPRPAPLPGLKLRQQSPGAVPRRSPRSCSGLRVYPPSMAVDPNRRNPNGRLHRSRERVHPVPAGRLLLPGNAPHPGYSSTRRKGGMERYSESGEPSATYGLLSRLVFRSYSSSEPHPTVRRFWHSCASRWPNRRSIQRGAGV